MLFPDERLLDRQGMVYRIISKLCSYTHMGKNSHDDVPDAFAQYALYYKNMMGISAQILDRRYYKI